MICKQCKKDKIELNSKQLCSDCVFENNHDGKSRQQVYLERSKNKLASKIVKNNIVSPKRSDVLRKDKQCYLTVFLTKPNKCEECGEELPNIFDTEKGEIVSIFQYSHILTKGSHPEHRFNPLNFNRLCLKCHQMWEFGDRSKMKILVPNKIVIEKLLRRKEKDCVKISDDGLYYFKLSQIKRGEADRYPLELIRINGK